MKTENNAIPVKRFPARKPEVVVIDDDESICEGCRQTLESEGFRAAIAFDGIQGLILIKALHPKVALVDLKMPGMSGQEVLARISELDSSVVPIVITGYGTINFVVETMKVGAYDFLTKPFEPEKLIDSVKQGIKLSQTRNERRYSEMMNALQENQVKPRRHRTY